MLAEYWKKYIEVMNSFYRKMRTSAKFIAGSIQITPFSEKLLYADNDGDGIPNKDNLYPDEAFDERLMIAEIFN